MRVGVPASLLLAATLGSGEVRKASTADVPVAVHVTVVAGTQDVGDGGLATEAVLAGVSSLTVDAQGNVYFCDAGHNRIRRVDSVSRTISTVAGSERFGIRTIPGTALGEPLSVPAGIALDAPNRVLYVAENLGQRRILKIDLLTTKLTDLGAPDGGFGKPVAMSLARSGLLVSDPLRAQVWRYDGTTWSGCFSDRRPFEGGIRGVAEDEQGNLYVALYFAGRLVRWNKADGRVTTVAARRAREDSPEMPLADRVGFLDGVAIDKRGQVYFSDIDHERICRYDPATSQVTIAHQSSLPPTDAGSWIPSSLAVDGEGHVWVSDIRHDRILRFNGRKAEVIAGGGDLGDGGPAVAAPVHPGRIAVDRGGNLYVSEPLRHRIRRIDARSGKITTLAGIGVADYNGDGMRANEAALNYPAGLALDAAGKHLYIADYYGNRIREVDLSTLKIATVAGDGSGGDDGDGGSALRAKLLAPHVVTFDPAGRLLLASAVAPSVRRVDLRRGIIERVAIGRRIAEPGASLMFFGMAALTPDEILLSDAMNSVIVRQGKDEGSRLDISGLAGPTDLALSIDGSLLICDTENNRLVRWTGEKTEVVIDGLGRPRGVAIDRHGTIYVADTDNNRVLKVTVDRRPAVRPSAGARARR